MLFENPKYTTKGKKIIIFASYIKGLILFKFYIFIIVPISNINPITRSSINMKYSVKINNKINIIKKFN